VKHVNHETSKTILHAAIAAGIARITMEDLTHIRARIKAGKRVRGRLHRWAFRQLQTFVEYKASAAGIAVDTSTPPIPARRVRGVAALANAPGIVSSVRVVSRRTPT
jgi:IS605 OrfB family transposase